MNVMEAGSERVSNVPGHVAIIMDGNGRWAQERGLPRSEGHRAGTDAAREIVIHSRELGIRFLTLYAFSRENWSRPKDEVKILFDLLVQYLNGEYARLLDNSIRLNVIGEWRELPFPVRKVIEFVIRGTAGCQEMTLNLALNYSAREEILNACRKLVALGLPPGELNARMFENELHTGGQPDPDIIIRTSGETRLSNFLLYQSAYSELYFTSTLWPDFRPGDLDLALAEYSKRKRRFGLTQEQIAANQPDHGKKNG